MQISATQRLVFKNTFVQLISRFFSSGSTFLIGILLARSLGAAGFGDLSKITTYVPFFYLIVDLGLNASFLRLRKEDKKIEWKDLFALRLTIGALAVAASIAITFLLPYGTDQGYTDLVRTGIFLYSLSIVTHAIITSANAMFQEHLEYDKNAVALVIGSLISVVGIFYIQTSVLTAISLLLLGSAVTAILSLFFVAKRTSIIPVVDWSRAKQLLIDTAPLSLTLLFNLLYFRIDSVILTINRPTYEVGVYNLAYKFFEFFLVIPVFFMNSLYPILLQQNNNTAVFNATLKKAGLFLLLLGVLTSCIVWVSSPLLPLINSSFSDATTILKILAVSFPIYFVSNLTLWTLITKRRHKALTIIYGSAMIINILSNLVFIPLYGPIASAVITVIGEGLVLVLSIIVLLFVIP